MKRKLCPGRFDDQTAQLLESTASTAEPLAYKCWVCGTLQAAQFRDGIWRPRDHYKSGAWRMGNDG